jgi:hypothetical protein
MHFISPEIFAMDVSVGCVRNVCELAEYYLADSPPSSIVGWTSTSTQPVQERIAF